MRRIAIIFAAGAVLASGPISGTAHAQSSNSLGAGWRQQQDEVREGVRRGRIMPLSEVREILIKRQRRGRAGELLDAGLEEQGGRSVYRVRWAAADGRRIDYLVDARTGAVLRADGE